MRSLRGGAAGLALGLLLACGSDGSSGTAVGTLERDRLELVAEAMEPIAEQLVREGERVQAGQLLLRLDAARLGATFAGAEAARDRVRARLAELVRGPRRERIAQARARLEGARGTLETARRDLERARSLHGEGVLAADRLDTARAAFDRALAERDTARAALEELLEGATVEELDQARAALAEAEAAVAEARVRVERLAVRAPVDGVVDALPFEPGERPPAGAVVAVLLAEGSPYARVYVPEAIRVHVAPGGAVRLRVDGTQRVFTGRVRTVADQASFTPFFALTEHDRGRLVYVAEVDLVESEARDLPTGLPVEATFDLDAEPGAGSRRGDSGDG